MFWLFCPDFSVKSSSSFYVYKFHIAQMYSLETSTSMVLIAFMPRSHLR